MRLAANDEAEAGDWQLNKKQNITKFGNWKKITAKATANIRISFI